MLPVSRQPLDRLTKAEKKGGDKGRRQKEPRANLKGQEKKSKGRASWNK